MCWVLKGCKDKKPTEGGVSCFTKSINTSLLNQAYSPGRPTGFVPAVLPAGWAELSSSSLWRLRQSLGRLLRPRRGPGTDSALRAVGLQRSPLSAPESSGFSEVRRQTTSEVLCQPISPVYKN